MNKPKALDLLRKITRPRMQNAEALAIAERLRRSRHPRRRKATVATGDNGGRDRGNRCEA